MAMKQKKGTIVRLIRLCVTLEPWILWCMVICKLSEAAEPFVNLFFSARILNELIGDKRGEILWRDVLLLLILNLVLYMCRQIFYRKTEIMKDRMYWKESQCVGDAFLHTDYENLETPGYQKKKQEYKEYTNMEGNPTGRVIECLEGILQYGLTILFSVMFAFRAFLPAKKGAAAGFAGSLTASLLMVLLLASAVGLSLTITRREKELKLTFQSLFIGSNRSFSYYQNLIKNYRNGKEIRLYHEGEMLLDGMKKALNLDLAVQQGNRQGGCEAVKAGCFVILSGLVYLFVGAKAMAGIFLPGMIVQYVGAVTRFTDGIIGIVTYVINFSVLERWSESLLDILEEQPVRYHGTIPVEKRDDNEYEIEFHDVGFRYPGAESWALRHLSLKLRVGEKLAVVGRNGSGKTTFIKLLCRLYDPTEGVITLNGIDIRKYDYDEYMEIFSVVFQDFCLFSFSLGQNVAASTEVDRDRARECLMKTGMGERLKRLPKGLDTPMYRDFEKDGVEISGGEAQKIALARALYRDAPFIILDEPTAALDPLAEYEIYSGFHTLAGDKTAVYISHRLSSCRFCDDIAVFDAGNLVQRGGHEALLAQEEGLYAKLWNAQAQYYTA